MHDLSLTQKFAEVSPLLAALPDTSFSDAPLSARTTLHIGGSPIATVTCGSVDSAIAVLTLLDQSHIPLLVLGGGSNLVIAGGELDFVAVVMECDQISLDLTTGVLRAEAGAVWDDVVSCSVEAGFGGIECLSGIPGSAGAVPVQNVGAYGAEVSEVLTRVHLLNRDSGVDEWVPAMALDLAYRYSNLKFTSRAVVLEVELQLTTDGLSRPLRFGELARRLGATEADSRLPVSDVREAVLALRRAKGMVYDETDFDTWSAGSFFTNPVVDNDIAEAVREKVGEDGMPCFPVAGTQQSKLSAAWLIERAGFPKGYPHDDASARLSTKHTLALTNRGSATAEDLVDLAREIRQGVKKEFGVTLVPEPVWIGVDIEGDTE